MNVYYYCSSWLGALYCELSSFCCDLHVDVHLYQCAVIKHYFYVHYKLRQIVRCVDAKSMLKWLVCDNGYCTYVIWDVTILTVLLIFIRIGIKFSVGALQ